MLWAGLRGMLAWPPPGCWRLPVHLRRRRTWSRHPRCTYRCPPHAAWCAGRVAGHPVPFVKVSQLPIPPRLVARLGVAQVPLQPAAQHTTGQRGGAAVVVDHVRRVVPEQVDGRVVLDDQIAGRRIHVQVRRLAGRQRLPGREAQPRVRRGPREGPQDGAAVGARLWEGREVALCDRVGRAEDHGVGAGVAHVPQAQVGRALRLGGRQGGGN